MNGSDTRAQRTAIAGLLLLEVMKNRTALAYSRAIYVVLVLLSLLSLGCFGLATSSPSATTIPPQGIILTPPSPTFASVVPAPERANPDVPYVQVTAGKLHACALRADGIARCWGGNPSGETNVPSLMLFQQISAGLNFTCGLSYAGAIACWGNDSTGQTAAPPGLFTQIAAGREHACALDPDGTAVCWGDIAYAPADVAFKAIDSGLDYSCGLTTAGRVECWGKITESVAGPFTALAVGLHHFCALRPDGVAACYGSNPGHQTEPPETAFSAIAAGWHHTCGITQADGFLECWGAGEPTQAGQRLDAPPGVFTALSSGWQNNCALRPDGAAQCWRQPNPPLYVRPSANLTAAFGGRIFGFPVELFPWPTGGFAVAELAGAIYWYDDRDLAEPRLILNLTDYVYDYGGRGLISAALDPDFDEFQFLYVYYHRTVGKGGQVEVRLSRFPIVDGAAVRADELVILNLPHPAEIHLDGAIRFGPDGMLYLGLDDNANQENAQNLASLYGKIIRIDVRGASAEQPYRIPDDNPFAGLPGAQPEIWAYGLHRPGRLDFDAAGNLWIADRASSRHEEVSIATKGANLGWPIFEGSECLATAEDCAALLATATVPAATYTHKRDRAIVGGVASPRPGTAYIFGDYTTRQIWALERDAAAATGWRKREFARADGHIVAFGAGAAGEVYVLIRNRPILRLEW